MKNFEINKATADRKSTYNPYTVHHKRKSAVHCLLLVL